MFSFCCFCPRDFRAPLVRLGDGSLLPILPHLAFWGAIWGTHWAQPPGRFGVRFGPRFGARLCGRFWGANCSTESQAQKGPPFSEQWPFNLSLKTRPMPRHTTVQKETKKGFSGSWLKDASLSLGLMGLYACIRLHWIDASMLGNCAPTMLGGRDECWFCLLLFLWVLGWLRAL